jgi:hypothetical protein
VIEHVYQDGQQRYLLIRLDGPAPGVAMIGTLAAPAGPGDIKLGDSAATTVSVNRFIYGPNADALAAESEARWRDWLGKRFAAEEALTAGGTVNQDRGGPGR